MIIKDLGAVSAYAYAVEKGYTGTEEEFAVLMASYATVAEEAAESAESASQSATSASQSAQIATTKASEASASASTASTKASEASQSATTASSKASEASASATSAQTAQGLAENARDDAIDAKTDAESARDMAQQYAESIDPDNIFSAYATDTASGSVASFADGADDIPMKSVKVAIEPVQDLNGYDHPWPAGGGKNILPTMTNATESRNGVTFTRNANGSISMSGTITAAASIVFAEFTLPAGSYTFSNIGSDTSSIGANADFYVRNLDTETSLASINYNTPADNKNFTLTETTNVRFYTVVQAGATISGTVYPMIRLASVSDSTFAPYSNICPISGWQGAQVARAGKNLIPPATRDTDTKSGVTWTKNSDGSISFSGTATVGTSLDFVNFKLPAGSYLFSNVGSTASYSGGSNIPVIYVRDLDNSVTLALINFGTVSDGVAFTLSAETNIRFYAVIQTDYAVSGTFYPMVRLSSVSDATYAPFTEHDTYSFTFPSEAGTVYGGVLDVTNGVLTVDRAFIASYNGETLPSEWISDRDKYVAGTTPTTGAQVCYELATPIVYQLTPTEIIKSLLGENNVWADAGDTSVEYRADTAMYIDKRIGTEAPMITTDNIVSGSYFMIGDNLYKATANIASGAAVVVGTNATAKTMAEALNEINA